MSSKKKQMMIMIIIIIIIIMYKYRRLRSVMGNTLHVPYIIIIGYLRRYIT